jgi:transcriptional regulator with XRE-family HTH domain
MGTLGKTLGENVRRLREARGLSQADLARLVGKDQAYMSRFESGRYDHPHRDLLIAIADALHVSLAEVEGEAPPRVLTPYEANPAFRRFIDRLEAMPERERAGAMAVIDQILDFALQNLLQKDASQELTAPAKTETRPSTYKGPARQRKGGVRKKR